MLTLIATLHLISIFLSIYLLDLQQTRFLRQLPVFAIRLFNECMLLSEIAHRGGGGREARVEVNLYKVDPTERRCKNEHRSAA